MIVASAVLALTGGDATGQDRPPVDLDIRRAAGLPDDSARGEIEMVDVGHDPLSTMVSIVARRRAGGWSVSSACAHSPQCAPGADHLARDYALSSAAGAKVDAIVAELRRGREPDGEPPSPGVIGGWLHVSLRVGGFRRDYHRVMVWGLTLGRLEELLKPPAA